MAALALFAGVLVAVTVGNPYAAATRKLTSKFLQAAVVGLGAGMDLRVVARVGLAGIGYTAVSIVGCLALGIALRRLLQVPANTGLLVAVGTAICGGSAIAAVAPVLRAEPDEVSVSLATVFILNAIALLIFPPIGHYFALDESQFGLWCALAIHDTSSVVGASMTYGTHALEVATTVKLARALWIVPVTLAVALWVARRGGPANDAKPARPWFIAGFLIAAALVTYAPVLAPAGKWVATGARDLMIVTLFLIGSGLTPKALRSVGARPLVQGVVLWMTVGTLSLVAIYARII